ncbi:MAG: hypothetical protein ACXVH6_04940 [Halobacteriota archaeon]
MLLCECGKFVDKDIFKAYIKTSKNPSTVTIGHEECGFMFDFIDGGMPKRYSSKRELKTIAMHFAGAQALSAEDTERFLLELERLKSEGRYTDGEILARAYRKVKFNK